jgi:ferredoxin-nitrite reductase
MWIAVARADQMRPESALVVRAGGKELALIRGAEGWHALDNSCPHAGGSLGEGVVEGSTVTCPLHAWRFDGATGACLTEKRPAQSRYPVKVEQGQVWIQLPDAGGPDWTPVAEEAELRPGAVRKVTVDGSAVALLSTTEGVFALRDGCAHEGGPLSEGALEGRTISCPWHGWRFDGKTGRCLNDKRFTQPACDVKIEQGKVWIRPRTGPRDEDPASKRSPVEQWKSAKHGFDVWPDLVRYARDKTPMDRIETPDLERMKWYGFFYRKNHDNDRYMVRVRLPGCCMNAGQARALASIARDCGYSILDATTRGNIQIQGLTVDRLPEVRERLERSGLTSRQSGHDNVRNVTSHPWSGIDPEELIDTRGLAESVQTMLIGNREFADLPRKFNVALTGRPDPAAHAWCQDLSFVAARDPHGAVGFQVLLGGNQGQSPKLAWRMPVLVPPDRVVEVTAATLRVFREMGFRHNRHQVRFRYLIERIGPDQVLSEIEKRLEFALPRFAPPPARPMKDDRFVGWFPQKQENLWMVGVCVPLGRLVWDQLEGLADVAEGFGEGTIRTTYDQNLVIPGIPCERREPAAYAVAKTGFAFEPDTVTRNVVACTGKQFCNLAVTETKGYGYRLIEELRRRRVQLHDIRVAMSGCPSSCAMSYTSDIGLKGVKLRRDGRVMDGFDVYLGGGFGERVRLGILYRKSVPCDLLPELIERIVREFYANRNSQSFSDYWRDRLKSHRAEADPGRTPSWVCSGCGHTHAGEDPPPFCPVCAALRARFEPPGGPKAPRPERRILIVGGGIGGHTAAQTARSLDPAVAITLVTDEKHSFYNRLNLTRFLAGEVNREDLFDYREEWYEEHGVDVLTGTRVIGLDPVKKTALLAQGRELEYDSCILTHGSAALTPPFFRPDLPGVFLLRTLEDTEGILSRAGPGVRAAVIGGGVLGLEAAYGLVKRGAAVRLFELAPRLMPRQLDGAAAAIFVDQVRDKGIEIHLGAGVRDLSGGRVALSDGRNFEADLIVVSTGIRPNIDWVKRSGVHCNRGVLVDDRMRTSAESIFAAGDAAEWRGQVFGLWTHAVDQARVAASNAVGKPAFYRGSLPVTVLKCLGIPLVSMGEIQEDGGDITSDSREDPKAGTYRKLIFRKGVPIGGLMLGSTAGMGEMRNLIEARTAPKEEAAIP